MDAARHAPGGRGGLELEIVEPLAERLQQRVEAVDHRVEQRVGEVVGALAADHPAPAPDAVAHRLEDVARRVLLHGEHEVLAEDDAELEALHGPPVVDVDHAGDDDLVVRVDVGLGPLGDVHHVLEGERVDEEDLPHPLQRGPVREAPHVDPRDPRAIVAEVGDALLESSRAPSPRRGARRSR